MVSAVVRVMVVVAPGSVSVGRAVAGRSVTVRAARVAVRREVRLPVAPAHAALLVAAPVRDTAAAPLAAALRLRGGLARVQQLVEEKVRHGRWMQGLALSEGVLECHSNSRVTVCRLKVSDCGSLRLLRQLGTRWYDLEIPGEIQGFAAREATRGLRDPARARTEGGPDQLHEDAMQDNDTGSVMTQHYPFLKTSKPAMRERGRG